MGKIISIALTFIVSILSIIVIGGLMLVELYSILCVYNWDSWIKWIVFFVVIPSVSTWLYVGALINFYKLAIKTSISLAVFIGYIIFFIIGIIIVSVLSISSIWNMEWGVLLTIGIIDIFIPKIIATFNSSVDVCELFYFLKREKNKKNS